MIAAILAVAAITVVGTFFIATKYYEIRNQAALVQTQTFRTSFAVLVDLNRLQLLLDKMQREPENFSDLLYDTQDAYDFLFVRADEFSRLSFDQNDSHLVANGERLINVVTALIDYGDLALAGQRQDFIDIYLPSVALIDEATALLFQFVEAQYQRQASAVHQQIATLKNLALSAIGLLLLFGSISGTSFVLFHRTVRAQEKRRLAEEKANYFAYFDSMTGLPNREHFRRSGLELMSKNSEPMLLLFDLDDFKMVNDLYGHAAGDAILIHAAQSIRCVIEQYGGTAARLGGDEFSAIVPGPISSMRAAAICEQIISRIAQPVVHDGASITPKSSIGVAFNRLLNGKVTSSLSDLQKAADIALYRAKEQGKNAYAFYDSDLAEMAARRRDIEVGIAEALENDGFSLAFQPQVDMATGHLKGFESLARWTKDGEVISPGEFISVAEATGQVVSIDLWGLRKSTLQAADWIRQGHLPVTISTNLSPVHFASKDIVEHVRLALHDSGLPPHFLVLEITESVLIEDMSSVMRILEDLRNLGVQIALDDFGTGYSSLAYLRKLDVDYIKIDQSFVRDLEDAGQTQVILDALVDIAKGLKKMLIVEGIETEDQASVIRNLGCDYGQGYLFGRPLPEADAREMIPRLTEYSLRKVG